MSIAAVTGVGRTDYLYGKIASGKRIQSAADDASGLAIANKLKRQSNGLDVGASNIMDGIGVANIKDGALATMQDSLQRIYELSLKASNGLYSADDKAMIQDEVGQLLEDIERTAVGTQYNEMKLMDGSMADMNIAANPDGTGMKIQMENVTLQALGIDGYDVTGNFDINDIVGAMEKISSSRSATGASTNAMEHAYNYNTGSSLDLVASRSRMEDLDIPKAVSEQKKNKLLKDYQMIMLNRKMQNDGMVLRLFGSR